MIPSPSLMVITGGPGSGKSTLIEALAREGYATAAALRRRSHPAIANAGLTAYSR
jgi:predicted ATPase